MVGSSNSSEFHTLILHCKNSQVKDYTEKISVDPWLYYRSHHDQAQQMTCCSVFTCLLSAVYAHFPFSCDSLLLLYHNWNFAVHCSQNPGLIITCFRKELTSCHYAHICLVHLSNAPPSTAQILLMAGGCAMFMGLWELRKGQFWADTQFDCSIMKANYSNKHLWDS